MRSRLRNVDLDDTRAQPHEQPQEQDKKEMEHLPTKTESSLQEQESLHVTRRDGPVLSDQVYVLGNDVQARYLTHALAGCKTIPPVRFFVNKRSMKRKWEAGGQCMHLYRGDDYLPSGRAIAELAVREEFWSSQELSGYPQDHIEQLVITVPAASTVRAFAAIRHRVDERTTICLIQDGLGVAEALNEAYFPDPISRPSYVLGHTTHHIKPVRNSTFSMSEVKRGRIYLSALGHDLGHSQISQMRCHPPVERWARPGHILSILTATPELQAAGFNLEQFLDFKLPLMVFKCVVDPLTVTLDSTYERLLNNNYAQQMMDQLLGEIINVISRLPELRGSTKYNKLRGGGGLRDAVHRQLDLKKNAESRMRALTRRGWETDIDFLNGYFVKRARDVGVRCPANESIIWMVKAKHEAQLAQRREEIEWDYDY